MGRHRRVKLALGARSTVVKAAAAMGVATALAAGINSAANGPVNPQAAADSTGDPVNLAGSSTPAGGHHTGTQATSHQSVPTGFATQSAVAPKLIQPAVSHMSHTANTAVQTAAQAPSGTATQAPAPAASQAPAPPASTTAGDTDSTQPPAAQNPPPASTQDGGSTSGSTSDSGSQGGAVGGLLNGVVGTVGGVVDGLLG